MDLKTVKKLEASYTFETYKRENIFLNKIAPITEKSLLSWLSAAPIA